MCLYGHMMDIRGTQFRFAPDLKRNLDQADAVAESIKTTIDKFIESNGMDAPVTALHAGVGTLRASVRARCVEHERAHGDLEHRVPVRLSLDRRAGVRWGLSHASARGDQRERAVLLRAAVAAYVGLWAV